MPTCDFSAQATKPVADIYQDIQERGFSVSPDGQFILFSQEDEVGYDLILVWSNTAREGKLKKSQKTGKKIVLVSLLICDSTVMHYAQVITRPTIGPIRRTERLRQFLQSDVSELNPRVMTQKADMTASSRQTRMLLQSIRILDRIQVRVHDG